MKKLLSLLLIAVMATAIAIAEDTSTADNLDMSVDENLAVPVVPPKAKNYVKASMDQLRRYFVKEGYATALLRDGEVIEVTVPCTSLFAPGATDLKESAASALKPFGIIVREPLKYKMLVTVHTDDTGDIMYADSITAARANAIDDYLWQLASEKETNVIPYGLGRDEPKGPNNSIEARNANRRVEFIIIPDLELIRMSGVKIK